MRGLHNYGFWLLAGQSVQTGIMAAQMRQLGAIGGELAIQRIAQQQQSHLEQVLFETEQAVAHLTSLSAQDRFAAAIHARLRLNAVNGLTVGMFHRYETKRAWASATEQLNALWVVIDNDAQLSPVARSVMHAIETLRHWQAFVGDPEARLAGVRCTAERTNASARNWLIAIPSFLVVGFVLFVIGAASNSPGLGVFGGVALIFGPLLSLPKWLSERRNAKRARTEREQLERQLADFKAFLADPMGGQLLDQIAARHPALAA